MTETYSVVEETEGTIIDEELLQSLREKCNDYHSDLLEVLDIVSPEYFVDGKSEKKPIGVSCNKIEAQFKLILGNPAIKRNINMCISNSDIEIAGYFVAPIAAANTILTDQEKNLGCALIEFGAGVTYLSVYKNNLLKYLVTIPIGANAITKDISSLNILEEEAEDLKITYGHALVDGKKEDDYPAKITANDKEINTEDLNDIIEARVNEIIANIKAQLEISGHADSLSSGIVIAGGGAALKNLAESIEEKTKQKVRVSHVENEVTIGLLSSGTENCVKEPEIPVIQPQPLEAGNFGGSLFSNDEIETKKIEQNQKSGKRKLNPEPKPQKTGGGFFSKITKKLAETSGGLFDSADSTGEEDENDEK
jgi:cell division protein FtsA